MIQIRRQRRWAMLFELTVVPSTGIDHHFGVNAALASLPFLSVCTNLCWSSQCGPSTAGLVAAYPALAEGAQAALPTAAPSGAAARVGAADQESRCREAAKKDDRGIEVAI